MKQMASIALLTIAALTLGACSTTQNTANVLDAAVGYENSDYKVTAAGGLNASISKSKAESSYRYAFSIDLKTAEQVKSVRIERLNGNGRTTLVIDDSKNSTKTGEWQAQSPTGARSYLHGTGLGNVSWIGQSAPLKMTEDQAPWLYNEGMTHEKYRITITSTTGKQVKFVQNTQISSSVKNTYLELLK